MPLITRPALGTGRCGVSPLEWGAGDAAAHRVGKGFSPDTVTGKTYRKPIIDPQANKIVSHVLAKEYGCELTWVMSACHSKLTRYPRMEKDDQILKSRDDKTPIFLSKGSDEHGNAQFELTGGSDCSWAKDGETIKISTLRPRIEPWLTALFQSEHLSLLVGSGLTHAAHYIATGKGLPGMSPVKFRNFDAEISQEAKESSERAGRRLGNIEDHIRVANQLLRGLKILSRNGNKETQSRTTSLEDDLIKVLEDFSASILSGERGLITANADQREKAFNYMVSFLMSFASRTGTRDRLNIFTTNYDRYIEAAAEVAGLHLIDRFVGSLSPVFRSSRLEVDLHYNPPGIRGEPRYLEGVARFSKLHGSLDWVNTDSTIRRMSVPFGAESIGPYLAAPGLIGAKVMQLMIYPNAAKDRETASYPYVELFRDFAAAVCRPNGALICFGYSFGDEHINRVIEDMLVIPSTHVVIISHSDPLGRIMQMYEKMGRPAQISLLIGDHLGDFKTIVDNYLPKPAIDRTTFRMAELIKSRWAASPSDSSGKTDPQNLEEASIK